MRLTFAVLIVLGLVSFQLACAAPTDTPWQIIDANNKKFTSAYNAGNIAAVAALYAPDAIAMPPGTNGTSFVGRDAIQQVFQGAYNSGLRLEFITGTVTPMNEKIWMEVSKYVTPQNTQGSYLVMWRQVTPGNWMLWRDIWNA